MKYSAAALVLATAASSASAQDISIFPECALPCIIDAVGTTSCEATDFACVCENMEAVKQAATPCVVEKCGIDTALNEVLPATEKFCADVGGGDGGDDGGETPPPPPTTTIVTVTTSAEPEPTPTETETPGGGDDGEDDGGEDDGEDDDDEPTETSSSGGSMVTPGPTGSAIPSPTGGDDGDDGDDTPPPATSSIHTAGAAVFGAVGSFGMMLLGAVAAL